MPVPKSPIRELGELLNQQPTLKGYAEVLVGRASLARRRAPFSVVIFPLRGPFSAARDTTSSFNDIDLTMAARLWALPSTDDPDGTDGAWDLRARFLAALWTQAIGDPFDPDDDTAAGFKCDLVDETWDVDPDSGVQGQELEVIFTLIASASDKTLKFGQVDEVWQAKTATLSVDLGSSDVTAFVDATAGYPSSGVLHIDGEQLGYTGLTPFSFTGLTRGISGTTAAAHVAGTTVQITPT